MVSTQLFRDLSMAPCFSNSISDMFPPVSLNFAGGASMDLRPSDYLVHMGFYVSVETCICNLNVFYWKVILNLVTFMIYLLFLWSTKISDSIICVKQEGAAMWCISFQKDDAGVTILGGWFPDNGYVSYFRYFILHFSFFSGCLSLCVISVYLCAQVLSVLRKPFILISLSFEMSQNFHFVLSITFFTHGWKVCFLLGPDAFPGITGFLVLFADKIFQRFRRLILCVFSEWSSCW